VHPGPFVLNIRVHPAGHDTPSCAEAAAASTNTVNSATHAHPNRIIIRRSSSARFERSLHTRERAKLRVGARRYEMSLGPSQPGAPTLTGDVASRFRRSAVPGPGRGGPMRQRVAARDATGIGSALVQDDGGPGCCRRTRTRVSVRCTFELTCASHERNIAHAVGTPFRRIRANT